MTTIVYHHESSTIATDGIISKGGVILTKEAEKMTERDGVSFFFCGSVCDEGLFIEGYFGAELKVIPECRAIVVDNSNAYYCYVNNEGHMEKNLLSFNDAIGSGQNFALAALDFGKNAAQAVEYAATRDVYTGGKIRLYDVR